MIKIAILGYGTIGSGVAEVLEINGKSIKERAGQDIEVKYILDLRDFPGDPRESKIVHDYELIVKDEEISIVVEAMGGVEPAFTFVKKALLAGKGVATSNKALVADRGAELMRIAKEQKVNFLFEASVGGGIPIIRPLHSSLTADVVEEITGILNGTTNYILSKMTFEGLGFADVLKEAQEKGFAEADPTADVEGHDACRKIAILTSIVTGRRVDFEEIHTEGITQISAVDIQYAAQTKRVIKLLATSKKTEQGYYARVAPVMLDSSHPLYSVNDVFNAVYLVGNVLGAAMFYGSGAGKLPTASAVVADVVDIVKNPEHDIMASWNQEKIELLDYKKGRNRFFVRTSDSREAIAAAFGSVEYVSLPHMTDEVGVLTEEMTEDEFEEKAGKLGSVISRIRVV